MKTTINRMFAILFASTLLFGCDAVQNASNQDKGAVIGATGGAVVGGVVGNNVGERKYSFGSHHWWRRRWCSRSLHW